MEFTRIVKQWDPPSPVYIQICHSYGWHHQHMVDLGHCFTNIVSRSFLGGDHGGCNEMINHESMMIWVCVCVCDVYILCLRMAIFVGNMIRILGLPNFRQRCEDLRLPGSILLPKWGGPPRIQRSPQTCGWDVAVLLASSTSVAA